MNRDLITVMGCLGPDGRGFTLEDTVEFLNLVLELKLKTDEKHDLVAYMRQL